MTTLPNRPRTALIVIDVQNGVVNDTPKRDDVIANINTLVGQARAQDVPVIWVQHNDDGLPRGSADWEWVTELARDDSEPLVHKSYGDSFEATDLESQLADREVGRLIRHRSRERRVHPIDPARRVHPRLRRDAGRRRAHNRRQDRVGSAAPGGGDRAHQPLLAVPERPRPHRRHRRHRRRHLRPGRLEAVRGGRVGWLAVVADRCVREPGDRRAARCGADADHPSGKAAGDLG